MNTRWLKQNLVMIICVVVFVALLGVIVWLERNAIAQEQDIEASLSAQQEEFQRLKNLKPYPSNENVDVLRRSLTEMETLYRSLQEATAQSQLKVPSVQTDIDFVDLLRKTQSGLREMANRRGVVIPDGFAFGFSRYNESFPCRNPVARGDDCNRVLALLAKQLILVEKLATIAIGNGVDSITMIRRVGAEPGSSVSDPDALFGTLNDDPSARYHVMPFELQFISSETALQSFLNALAQSESFFIVKKATVDSKVPSSVIHTIELARTSPAGARPRTIAPASQRKWLLMNMRIELVEFASPQSQTNETKTGRR